MGKHLLPRTLLFILQCLKLASILGRCTSVCGCRNACNGWSLTSKNASNGTCDPRKTHPILLAMATASIQYWCRRRRARSKIASNRGGRPPKNASNGASQLPKLLPILLAMEELGFQNGKTASNVPSNFPCNGRAWLPKWRALLQMSQAISHAISAGVLAISQAISHVVSHAEWVMGRLGYLQNPQNNPI